MQKISVSVLSGKMTNDNMPKMIDRNFCRPIAALGCLFYDTNSVLKILSNSFQVEMKSTLKENEIKQIVANVNEQRKKLLNQTEIANRYFILSGTKMARSHPSNLKNGYTLNLDLDVNADVNLYNKMYEDKSGDGISTKTLLKRAYKIINYRLNQLSKFWRDGDFNTKATDFQESFYQTTLKAIKPIKKAIEKNEACK